MRESILILIFRVIGELFLTKDMCASADGIQEAAEILDSNSREVDGAWTAMIRSRATAGLHVEKSLSEVSWGYWTGTSRSTVENVLKRRIWTTICAPFVVVFVLGRKIPISLHGSGCVRRGASSAARSGVV